MVVVFKKKKRLLQLYNCSKSAKESITTPLWPSVRMNSHSQSWGFGVLRDSRIFRVRQKEAKHLALGRSWCHWKGLEV